MSVEMIEMCEAEWKETRKALKRVKIREWKVLCESFEIDVWGEDEVTSLWSPSMYETPLIRPHDTS